MRFEQKRWGIRTRFDIGADALEYRIADAESAREATVAWHALGTTATSLTVTSRQPLLWLTLCFLACMMVGAPLLVLVPAAGMLLVALGLVTFLVMIVARLTRFFQVTMSVLSASPGGSVRIIADADRDRILEALVAARHAWLRRTLFVVDYAAEPTKEAAKLEWLLQQGVIDEGEHAEALTRLRAAADMPAGSERLN